jgi:hypothetical protein
VIGRPEFDDFGQGFLDIGTTKLSMLSLSEQFVYEFDFGRRASVGPMNNLQERWHIR